MWKTPAKSTCWLQTSPAVPDNHARCTAPELFSRGSDTPYRISGGSAIFVFNFNA